MKERPILFSAAMVRAILDGRKTQTRRVLTVPWRGSVRALPYEPYWVESDGRLLFCDEWGDYHDVEKTVLSPYGQPGDRLWVKETFGLLTGAGHRYVYRADGQSMQRFYPDEPIADMKWKPSIFMSRHLSRITLEVTGVRVERLQDISEEDARAEGVVPEEHRCFSHRGAFNILWDNINAKRAPWASNPWVWVVEFKRVVP